MKNRRNLALLLIDVQKGFLDSEYWGQRNNPCLEEKISALLTSFRGAEVPVLHVQHRSLEPKSPLRPNQDGVNFMDFAKPLPNEMVFTKAVNSAFIGTSLEAYLRKNGITDLVLVGLTSDHCVSTSARMAANLGFNVTIAEDAVATFERIGFDGTKYPASLVHDVALASLRNEFASVQSTQDLIALLQSGSVG